MIAQMLFLDRIFVVFAVVSFFFYFHIPGNDYGANIDFVAKIYFGGVNILGFLMYFLGMGVVLV